MLFQCYVRTYYFKIIKFRIRREVADESAVHLIDFISSKLFFFFSKNGTYTVNMYNTEANYLTSVDRKFQETLMT